MNRLLTALLLSLFVLPAFAADEKLPPAPTTLPVVAWGGVPNDKASVKRYREMVEAGFTINFTSYGNADATLKALDVAKAGGMQLMVPAPAENSPDLATFVAKVKPHPALAGYYLRDEPDASLFPMLGAWERKVQALDADHFCYINLFPTYATPDQLKAPNYPAYLQKYMETVPVRVLSFDHYPVIQEGNKPAYLRGDYYQNLEWIAAAARKAKIPFWAFSISTHLGPYPAPTLAHVRCQIFSDLAYGAQGLQYFTYWQVTGSSEGEFTDAPIRAADGKRTKTYDYVKQVNAEARGLWPVFCGAQVLAVRHAGASIPAGTTKYEPEGPVKALSITGPGAVLSHLRNGSREYLAIVNRDINQAQQLKVTLDAQQHVQRVEKDGTLRAVEGGALDVQIEPGDMVVLTWAARP
jgi:hypothetical protein